MGKVYVASAFARRFEAAELAQNLEAQGWKIAYRWWMNSEEFGGKPESEYTTSELASIGGDEYDAVKSSNLCICLWDYASMGAAMEVATAINWRIPVVFVVSSEESRKTLLRTPLIYSDKVRIFNTEGKWSRVEDLLAESKVALGNAQVIPCDPCMDMVK